MSRSGITGIDHILLAVRDLDAARMGWTRLGFTLSPRGKHLGRGTGNYCIMFLRDYIELFGVVGGERVSPEYTQFLAARDNDVPFYVALPSPTIDWTVDDGIKEIPIEERHGSEVSEISGRLANGDIATVRLIPEGSPVANYAFDVTPSRLVTGLITERGVCAASADGLLALFPERRNRRTGT